MNDDNQTVKLASIDRTRTSRACHVITNEQGAMVAEVYQDSLAPTFAAAPDMLEALQLVQAAISEHGLLDVRKRFSLSLAHAAIGAAIHKATQSSADRAAALDPVNVAAAVLVAQGGMEGGAR